MVSKMFYSGALGFGNLGITRPANSPKHHESTVQTTNLNILETKKISSFIESKAPAGLPYIPQYQLTS